MVTQSIPVWEADPLDLVRRAVEADPSMRTNIGGWRGGGLGLTGLDYCAASIQARISGPDGERSYQWTWAAFDAGKPGQLVPFTRMSIWTNKAIKGNSV